MVESCLEMIQCQHGRVPNVVVSVKTDIEIAEGRHCKVLFQPFDINMLMKKQSRASCCRWRPGACLNRTILMELAGVTDGNYGQLQVAGILNVGGGSAVELFGGFVPAADADSQIFDAGTLSGTFSAVLLPDLPGMLGWDSSRLYSSGTRSVILEPAMRPLLALGMLLAGRRR